MPRIPRRFRRPRAELRVETEKTAPPDDASGGVARLRISLLPREPFRVRRGRLELALLTTRFARTVLDGYHEYTSEQVCRTAVLCENIEAQAGRTLAYRVELPLPDAPSHDASHPERRQWQARARLEVDGCRELSAGLPAARRVPAGGRPAGWWTAAGSCRSTSSGPAATPELPGLAPFTGNRQSAQRLRLHLCLSHRGTGI